MHISVSVFNYLRIKHNYPMCIYYYYYTHVFIVLIIYLCILHKAELFHHFREEHFGVAHRVASQILEVTTLTTLLTSQIIRTGLSLSLQLSSGPSSETTTLLSKLLLGVHRRLITGALRHNMSDDAFGNGTDVDMAASCARVLKEESLRSLAMFS